MSDRSPPLLAGQMEGMSSRHTSPLPDRRWLIPIEDVEDATRRITALDQLWQGYKPPTLPKLPSKSPSSLRTTLQNARQHRLCGRTHHAAVSFYHAVALTNSNDLNVRLELVDTLFELQLHSQALDEARHALFTNGQLSQGKPIDLRTKLTRMALGMLVIYLDAMVHARFRDIYPRIQLLLEERAKDTLDNERVTAKDTEDWYYITLSQVIFAKMYLQTIRLAETQYEQNDPPPIPNRHLLNNLLMSKKNLEERPWTLHSSLLALSIAQGLIFFHHQIGREYTFESLDIPPYLPSLALLRSFNGSSALDDVNAPIPNFDSLSRTLAEHRLPIPSGHANFIGTLLQARKDLENDRRISTLPTLIAHLQDMTSLGLPGSTDMAQAAIQNLVRIEGHPGVAHMDRLVEAPRNLCRTVQRLSGALLLHVQLELSTMVDLSDRGLFHGEQVKVAEDLFQTIQTAECNKYKSSVAYHIARAYLRMGDTPKISRSSTNLSKAFGWIKLSFRLSPLDTSEKAQAAKLFIKIISVVDPPAEEMQIVLDDFLPYVRDRVEESMFIVDVFNIMMKLCDYLRPHAVSKRPLALEQMEQILHAMESCLQHSSHLSSEVKELMEFEYERNHLWASLCVTLTSENLESHLAALQELKDLIFLSSQNEEGKKSFWSEITLFQDYFDLGQLYSQHREEILLLHPPSPTSPTDRTTSQHKHPGLSTRSSSKDGYPRRSSQSSQHLPQTTILALKAQKAYRAALNIANELGITSFRLKANTKLLENSYDLWVNSDCPSSEAEDLLDTYRIIEELAQMSRNENYPINDHPTNSQLAKSESSQSLQRIIPHLLLSLERPEEAWMWIQTSKARFISEQLRLDQRIPERIQRELQSDVEAVKLLDEEMELLRKIKEAPGYSAPYMLHQQLEILREEKMRGNLVLREWMDVREGRCGRLDKFLTRVSSGGDFSLRNILNPDRISFVHSPSDTKWFETQERMKSKMGKQGTVESEEKERTVVALIDYSFIGTNLYIFISRDSQLTYEPIPIPPPHLPAPFTTPPLRPSMHHTTLKRQFEISSFDNLLETISDSSSFDVEEDFCPLRNLDFLVEPFERFTKPDDLLVFCPAEEMRGIPLHALRLREGLVIERNPCVYTSDFMGFARCLERAKTQSSSSTSSGGSSSRVSSFHTPSFPSSLTEGKVLSDQEPSSTLETPRMMTTNLSPHPIPLLVHEEVVMENSGGRIPERPKLRVVTSSFSPMNTYPNQIPQDDPTRSSYQNVKTIHHRLEQNQVDKYTDKSLQPVREKNSHPEKGKVIGEQHEEKSESKYERYVPSKWVDLDLQEDDMRNHGITDLAQGINAGLLFGEEVTKESMMNVLKDSRVVLFLGEFDQDDEEECLRLFDSPLTISDLFSITLPHSLLLLCGCSTSNQTSKSHFNPFNLINSALISGANSVIASLWSVEHDSSINFSSKFLNNLTTRPSHLTTSAALKSRSECSTPCPISPNRISVSKDGSTCTCSPEDVMRYNTSSPISPWVNGDDKRNESAVEMRSRYVSCSPTSPEKSGYDIGSRSVTPTKSRSRYVSCSPTSPTKSRYVSCSPTSPNKSRYVSCSPTSSNSSKDPTKSRYISLSPSPESHSAEDDDSSPATKSRYVSLSPTSPSSTGSRSAKQRSNHSGSTDTHSEDMAYLSFSPTPIDSRRTSKSPSTFLSCLPTPVPSPKTSPSPTPDTSSNTAASPTGRSPSTSLTFYSAHVSSNNSIRSSNHIHQSDTSELLFPSMNQRSDGPAGSLGRTYNSTSSVDQSEVRDISDPGGVRKESMVNIARAFQRSILELRGEKKTPFHWAGYMLFGSPTMRHRNLRS
ncbi:hypothetical protein M231_05888 [Tremella mesenterica]|uniref:CHAT domain-containing protein n=1 Tax=Tremella mesenterica TaxID=5217 RepID=A0A4Q1BGU5_TREME|nr:hypothetical protein M231_05888 [Tremella mesenterica]